MAITKKKPMHKSQQFRAKFSSSTIQLATNLLLYVFLYGVSISIANRILSSTSAPLLLAGLLLTATLLAFIIVRIFIVQHDCAHNAYYKKVKTNKYTGIFLSVFTHVPHVYWQQQHAYHHAHSGNLQGRNVGDIKVLTRAEYSALPRYSQLAYRIYRNPFVMVVLGSLFQFFIWFKVPNTASRKNRKALQSIVITDLLIALRVIALSLLLGWESVLIVESLSLWIAAMAAIVLFYVQHNYAGTYWRNKDEWSHEDASLRGSSFLDLGAIGHWLTGNIGFHHMHHLDSRIPNYLLPAAHKTLSDQVELTVLGYRDIPKSFALKVWDETTCQLVGFEV